MIKYVLFTCTLFITTFTYAQIKFEKGYFIDNNSKRTDCLIKNVDWKNNPSQFTFKLKENDATQTADIKTTKEFGVTNVSRFVRSEVYIDRSPEVIARMNKDRYPYWKKETLFLRVLIEGDANLYYFDDAESHLYFFNVKDDTIGQLIYKRYRTEGSALGVNRSFLQQLVENLRCGDNPIQEMEKMKYELDDLTKFFTRYNTCVSGKSNIIDEKSIRSKFNFVFRVKSGIDYYKFSATSAFNFLGTPNINMPPKVSPRIGLELETILPFNKNKWGIFLEPTLQFYQATDNASNYSIKYSTFDIPLGFRHYFFLNDNSKIFLDFAYLFEFNLGKNYVRSPSRSLDYDLLRYHSVYGGVGYAFKKHGLELRYYPSKKPLNTYFSWDSKFSNMSLVYGYKF